MIFMATLYYNLASDALDKLGEDHPRDVIPFSARHSSDAT